MRTEITGVCRGLTTVDDKMVVAFEPHEARDWDHLGYIMTLSWDEPSDREHQCEHMKRAGWWLRKPNSMWILYSEGQSCAGDTAWHYCPFCAQKLL